MVAADAILVTGGAGYIGSHVVLALRDAGYRTVVLDDLSTGVRGAVPDGVPFALGDVGDVTLLAEIIGTHGVTAVMHFAGSVVVPESVRDPLGYYRNNTVKSHALIETCVRCGVDRFVFSSTAAIYGIPKVVPVTEDAEPRPINPYGASKLMTEWMLRDTASASGFRYVALRYFNVAGADPAGRAGQSTPRATHLIKVACEAAAGLRSEIELFGDDYATPDGTCVRDYIHVSDLAAAHLLALRHLAGGGQSLALNCGYGKGYSVKQVLDAVRRIADRDMTVRIGPRRPGDSPTLIAAAGRLEAALGWKPKYDDLDMIVASALDWEKRLLNAAF